MTQISANPDYQADSVLTQGLLNTKTAACVVLPSIMKDRVDVVRVKELKVS